MSDREISEVGAPVRWLLLGFVLVMGLAIGMVAFLYQPPRPETICSNIDSRCGDKPDASMQ